MGLFVGIILWCAIPMNGLCTEANALRVDIMPPPVDAEGQLVALNNPLICSRKLIEYAATLVGPPEPHVPVLQCKRRESKAV